MDISFYQLTSTPLEQALPALLEKIWQSGARAVVLAEGPEHAEFLADKLWTYKQLSFLPHGTKKDGQPENQPIWITDVLENPNKANILLQTHGFIAEEIAQIPTLGFERCLDLFNGHIPGAREAAKTRYTQAEVAGWQCRIWQQNEAGVWEKGTL